MQRKNFYFVLQLQCIKIHWNITNYWWKDCGHTIHNRNGRNWAGWCFNSYKIFYIYMYFFILCEESSTYQNCTSLKKERTFKLSKKHKFTLFISNDQFVRYKLLEKWQITDKEKRRLFWNSYKSNISISLSFILIFFRAKN